MPKRNSGRVFRRKLQFPFFVYSFHLQINPLKVLRCTFIQQNSVPSTTILIQLTSVSLTCSLNPQLPLFGSLPHVHSMNPRRYTSLTLSPTLNEGKVIKCSMSYLKGQFTGELHHAYFCLPSFVRCKDTLK